MAKTQVTVNGSSIAFTKNQDLDWTEDVRKAYQVAEPFPHTVIDDFLPGELINAIVSNFPSRDDCTVLRKHNNAYMKRGYRPDDLGDNPCRNYLYLFNSEPFVEILEHLTGHDGLIPDPHFHGGGLHEIDAGGRLALHTDFNLHDKLRLVRRINVLIYLNEGWQPEYGGDLQLWDTDITECVKSVSPIFNRCVIFNTDKTSFHGHPDPVSCPEHLSRRSIALYYYMSPMDHLVNSEDINTNTDFRQRPGGVDEKISEENGTASA